MGGDIIDRYISTCCKAFILYEGITCKCSACKQEITKISKTPLTIGVKFSDDNATNISGEAINAYKKVCKRFATDPTYELCLIKCKKCGSYSRYTRLPQGQFIYICSNEKCREVFEI